VARAFSLIEAMVVVAIVGILAALAVPNLTPMATHYRALEGARSVLAAVNQGRGLAQRNNAPVEVFVEADRLTLRTAVVDDNANPDAIRKIVTGWADDRVIHFGDDGRVTDLALTANGATTTVQPGQATAVFRFCPSSDTYYRIGAAQAPVCGVGNVTSHAVRLTTALHGQRFIVEVRAALGAIDLRQAP
jgi:prepilin-type N-terminal cleavage/methylation domain-containing protein